MKLPYVLRLADDALILSQRLGEWTGHGPILEQDIALTNTALDHIGRARSLYQYAAELFNNLPKDEQSKAFTSMALQQIVNAGIPLDEDNLAYLRDGWDFRNPLLTERANIDWAYTVARALFLDCFNYFYFSALAKCSDATLAAVAEKSLKEVTYHLKWSSEWVIRLGDGTEESHAKIQEAINETWPYTGELFQPSDYETAMQAEIGAPDLAAIRTQWTERIAAVLAEATIDMPKEAWMHRGGKEGVHSEELGYILAEMQYMQRTYPGQQW